MYKCTKANEFDTPSTLLHALGTSLTEIYIYISCNLQELTLDPVSTDWTEEVRIQAMRFLNLVQ